VLIILFSSFSVSLRSISVNEQTRCRASRVKVDVLHAHAATRVRSNVLPSLVRNDFSFHHEPCFRDRVNESPSSGALDSGVAVQRQPLYIYIYIYIRSFVRLTSPRSSRRCSAATVDVKSSPSGSRSCDEEGKKHGDDVDNENKRRKRVRVP